MLITVYEERRPWDQICGTLGEKEGRWLSCLREFVDLSTAFCNGHAGLALKVVKA